MSDAYVASEDCQSQDCTLSVLDVGGLTSTLRPAMDTLAAAMLTAIQNKPDAILSKLEGGGGGGTVGWLGRGNPSLE